jgi:hypothetical protein
MAEEAARIERLAGRLKLLVWGLMAAGAAFYVAGRMGVWIGHLRIITRGPAEGLSLLSGLLSDLGLILLLLALWQLAAMLALVERGDRFSARLTRCFRRFALFLLLATAIGAAVPLLPIFSAHLPGQIVQLGVSLRDILLMVVAAVLFLIARLLDEGQRVQSDLNEIV